MPVSLDLTEFEVVNSITLILSKGSYLGGLPETFTMSNICCWSFQLKGKKIKMYFRDLCMPSTITSSVNWFVYANGKTLNAHKIQL